MPIYCANDNKNATNNHNNNNNGTTNHPVNNGNGTTATVTTGLANGNLFVGSNNNNNGHHYSAHSTTINGNNGHNGMMNNKKQHLMIINNEFVGLGGGVIGGGTILNNHMNSHIHQNIHHNHNNHSPPITHQLSSTGNQSAGQMANNIHNSHQHHHQHVHSNSKNKTNSSSLIMAINRFKNSVKDMKETVLIPTRLSDLTTTNYSKLNDVIYENNELVDINEENDSSLSPSETMKNSPTHSNGSHSVLHISQMIQDTHNPKHLKHHFKTSSTSASLSANQNLYEQFKLLDLIDKILSSDTILTVSIRPNNGFSSMENNDNNNNPRRRMLRLENGKLHHQQQQQQVFDDDDMVHQATNMNGKHNKLNRQASSASNGSNSSSNGSSFRSNSPDSGNIMMDPYYDQYYASLTNTNGGGALLSDCSLLKIKEKLEYHLISLKSILNMMSDGAEYITRTYLEDIQSGEDRFDQSKRSGSNSNSDQHDPPISTRHYYTSN